MNREAFGVTLSRYIKSAGSQVEAAQKLGISATYLCDLKKGRRAPGQKILSALGLQRIIEYEKSA